MTIDIIGDLFEPPVFPEGFVPGDPEPEPVRLPGFHVNVTPDELEKCPSLKRFVVTPDPFQRLFAGDPSMTVALRFTTEAKARKYFPLDPVTNVE